MTQIHHLNNIFIFKYIEDFWNLLFPLSCETCGQILNKNENIICTKCLTELPRTNYSNDLDNALFQLFNGRLYIQKATALFSFQKESKFRKLLHKLKYKNKPEIGVLLGKELGSEMLKSNNFNDIDLLVAVPLHVKRKKQRGYNQSEMICKGISEITNIKISTDNLIRNIETTTQTKMTKNERWNNVEGKFKILNPELFINKHIMLIDDVITTGATTEACGEELLKINGVKLSIGVIAKV